MITGYNTDVEYDGVVYHVQTEDKGLQTPIILSLVYAGGAILASKRTNYDDLVARGFDEEVLTKRLQRQHKLICAAVSAGRIEDLKRMTQRESSSVPSQNEVTPEAAKEERKESAWQLSESSDTGSRPDQPLIETPSDDEAGLTIQLLEEEELRGGQTVTLRLLVTRAGRELASKVPVVVKTLGTAFSPQLNGSTTDERGVAEVSVALPDFRAGRAAILVQANCDGETAELRRIIFPSKS